MKTERSYRLKHIFGFWATGEVQEVEQTVSVFFHVIFHMLLQKLFAKIDFFCLKWILHHIADLRDSATKINGHKCHDSEIGAK